MCTVADKTALLQSQGWYLIIRVTGTFPFKMSLAFVKNDQKQKAAVRTTHLAWCSLEEREYLSKNVKFPYKIIFLVFYHFHHQTEIRCFYMSLVLLSDLSSGPFIPMSSHHCPLLRTARKILAPGTSGYFAFRKSLFCKVSSYHKLQSSLKHRELFPL